MNTVETEIPFAFEAKTSGSKRRKVMYSLVDSYHNICICKKDIILGQIRHMKDSKYSNDRIDQIILEKEIAGLR